MGRFDMDAWRAVSWRLAATLAALAAALVGIVLTAGLVTLAWVEVPDVGFLSTLSLGVRLWLLAHGAALDASSAHISIIPLGLTALQVLALVGGARLAGMTVRGELVDNPGREGALALRVGAFFGAIYLVCVMVPAFLVGNQAQSGRAFVGALLLGVGSGVLGAGRALGWHPLERLPVWARSLPRAVAAGLGVMFVVGLAVGVAAIVMHGDRVTGLHRSLHPTGLGSVVLVLLQLLWLPNFVLWCSSWALGAGISLGAGTVVSPAQNLTGLLPALPVFGAVPANGPGPKVALLWLVSGAVAGAASAWVVVRARRAARFDETALVGGLSGVLTGAVLWLLARLSNGDLGRVRLVGIGARLTELGVMAPTIMGTAGLVTGLVLGLVRGRGQKAEPADPAGPGPEDEATMALDDLDQVVHREDS